MPRRRPTLCTWAVRWALAAMSAAGVCGLLAPAASAVGSAASGPVWAAGSNSYGQIGAGATSLWQSPVAVPGVPSAVAISAGLGFSLAVVPDGSVRTWGNNGSGELGTGTVGGPLAHPNPARPSGLPPIADVVGGGGYALALSRDGRIFAWGGNAHGELGVGDYTDHPAPRPVSGVTSAVQVSTSWATSLALLRDGTVRGWGMNNVGQTGAGHADLDPNVPARVPGVAGAIQVAAGSISSYALLANGRVLAWGSNGNGQLGNGGPTSSAGNVSYVPVAVSRIVTARAIAAGQGHVLALLRDGTVRAWGSNGSGELGDGTTTERTTPVAVRNLDHVVAIAAGSGISLAVRDDGTVWAWGNTGGFSLTTYSTALPVRVPALTGVSAVSANMDHILALRGAPPPSLGKTATVTPVTGTVLVKAPGSKRFVPLSTLGTIPFGSTLDATKGTVKITSAAPRRKTQSADFSAGRFTVNQEKKTTVTEAALTGGTYARCPRAGRASAAAGRTVRRLWGSGRGRFRTRGRYGSATVRGTRWTTEDRCDGTLFKVSQGSLTVRDFPRRTTVTVNAPKSYLARAKR